MPHVLTDITSQRTICATKLKTAKVSSTNTRIVATIVMIYAPHARKVMKLNEELILLNQNATSVSKQRNLLAQAMLDIVGALPIKNQLTLVVIKHMEKLLQQEMT